MAAIITVHGTGATGPLEGEAWWQKGSAFHSDVIRFVEGGDGTLQFEPVIWDGENSENSRRSAASALLGRLSELEDEGKQYALIGHSHGGSVISNTLLLSTYRKRELNGLSLWITIGTPFIESEQLFWLFSRVSILGKSALITLLMFALAMSVGTLGEQISGMPAERLTTVGIVTLIGFLCIVIGVPYLVMFLANSRRHYPFKRWVRKRADEKFGRLWWPLSHRNDEAVSALSAIRDIRFKFVKEDFAVPLLSLASIFVLPLILCVIAASPKLMGVLIKFAPTNLGAPYIMDGKLFGDGNLFMVNLGALMMSLLLLFKNMSGFQSLIGEVLIVLVIIPGFLYAVSLIVTVIITAIAKFVSRFLSRTINKITWIELRRTAFGGDIIGEATIASRNSPIWGSRPVTALPAPLDEEISLACDRAAASAFAKFRKALSTIVTSEDKDTRSFFFSEYLTWKELIHTSYFNAPRFRLLVAYAIAHSPGFRPSAALTSHPDYELVARWYEAMRPRGAVGAEDGKPQWRPELILAEPRQPSPA